jgi:alkylation response protein AidB-like acyl-CoA dehydrogenase
VQLTFDADVEAFRADFVAFLDDHLPSEAEALERSRSSSHIPEWARRWQRLMFDNGWLLPGYPPEFGGRNATLLQQYVHQQELARRRSYLTFNPQGVGIISASLISFGTPEQQRRWAVPILRAEMTASLGMSEPGAGSDLASLRTRAVRDGDDFVVNGQKVWTSGAHHSDWCMCYVRTDPDVPKHKGISVLIIDMHSPGVEARPFAELSEPDYFDFNEVFFTDVVVPRDQLLGELNNGWALTQGSLSHERAMLWIDHAYAALRAFHAVAALGDHTGSDGRPLRESAHFRDLIGGFYVDTQAQTLMGYRGLSKVMAGKPAPEHSLLKLYGSEKLQELLLTGAEIEGHASLDLDRLGPKMWRDGAWVIQYLRSFAGTIPGGTSEIQRNIIAERVLGLPRA